MGVMTAAVVFLAVGFGLHVFVTYGLVRRLRVHTEMLTTLSEGGAGLLRVGTVLPEFTAETVDNIQITRDDLGYPGAVALLAVNCRHCRTNLPHFLNYLNTARYSRDHVLAVVVTKENTDPQERDTMLTALQTVAMTICTTSADQLVQNFDATAFPAFYLTGSDATITAADHAVRKLPAPAAAAAR
jgi:hypothetical protein